MAALSYTIPADAHRAAGCPGASGPGHPQRFHLLPLPRWPAVLILACLLWGAPALQAQTATIAGHVRTGDDGRPLAGAMATLVDEEGRDGARRVTDHGGGFAFEGVEPGTYSVRVRHLGYASLETDPFELGPGERRELEFVLDASPIALGEIRAERERVCRIPEEEGSELAFLWGEIRTGLEAVALVHREGEWRYELASFERVWNPATGSVRGERWAEGEPTRRPFATERTPRDLMERGWVQGDAERGYSYFAPDPEILLSEAFLTEHCFRIERDRARRGQVGLSFEPRPGREPPGIRGVIWVDEEALRLVDVEFTYTRHLMHPTPPWELNRLFGGSVVFTTLPNGAPIVGGWVLRAPEWRRAVAGEERADRPRDELPPVPLGGAEEILERVWLQMARAIPDPRGPAVERMDRMGFVVQEKGGILIRAYDEAGREILGPASVVVEGRAVDEETGQALAGAEVRLEGTGRMALTDDQGRFRIVVPYEGRWLFAVAAEAGEEPFREVVEVARGMEEVALAVTAPEVRSEVDPTGVETLEALRDSVALVAGQVRDGGRDGEPVQGAVVRLRGETEELETETDELGVFLFDAVPLGRYSLSIRHPDYLTVTSTMSVEEPGAPVRVQAALQRDVVALRPIEVTVERPPAFRPGPLRGAYERAERMRAVGLGRVVDREEIDRRSVPSIVDLLSGIGGVQVVPGGRPGERRIAMSRASIELWASPRDAGDRCYPVVYLDGTRLRVPGTRRGAGHPDEVPQLDRMVAPSQLELIEVYRSPAEIPAEYSGPEARCGVIAVWTRRG